MWQKIKCFGQFTGTALDTARLEIEENGTVFLDLHQSWGGIYINDVYVGDWNGCGCVSFPVAKGDVVRFIRHNGSSASIEVWGYFIPWK